MARDYRHESRRNYLSADDCNFTPEQLNTGALLRIADSMERIEPNIAAAAARFVALQEEAERLRRLVRYYETTLKRERRRSAALKGHLAKAKRKDV